MKVILAGTTGFVGKEVLTQCLSHPSITSIVILTRRDPDPPISDPKVQIHRMQDDDFLSYSNPQLTAALRGAHACIWTLGVLPTLASSSDTQALRRVTVDFTEQAAQAFTRTFASSSDGTAGGGNRFRFVYLSGALAERDQSKSLWFAGPYRRVRGAGENALLAHATLHGDTFESYIMRPAMVLNKSGSVLDLVRGLAPSVRVDVLAGAAVDIAVRGNKEKIWENGMIAGWKSTVT